MTLYITKFVLMSLTAMPYDDVPFETVIQPKYIIDNTV